MATARRDMLLELQAKAQKKWADEKTFEVTAPRDGTCDREALPVSLWDGTGSARDRERFLELVASSGTSGTGREDAPSMDERRVR